MSHLTYFNLTKLLGFSLLFLLQILFHKKIYEKLRISTLLIWLVIFWCNWSLMPYLGIYLGFIAFFEFFIYPITMVALVILFIRKIINKKVHFFDLFNASICVIFAMTMLFFFSTVSMFISIIEFRFIVAGILLIIPLSGYILKVLLKK
jgi:hypothetical protein